MPDNVELLKQYKELLDSGILTQEEFEAKRDQIVLNMQKSLKEEQSQTGTNQLNADTVAAGQESTFGWAVLGFFIPLVGLILFLVWNDNTNKKKGKSSGKGALVGIIVYILSWIILASMATNPYFFGTLFHKNDPEYYDPNPYDDEFDYDEDGYLSGEEKEDYYYYTYDK